MRTLSQDVADLQMLHNLRDFCEKFIERYSGPGTLAERIGCSPAEAEEIAAKMKVAAIKKRDAFQDQINFYSKRQR